MTENNNPQDTGTPQPGAPTPGATPPQQPQGSPVPPPPPYQQAPPQQTYTQAQTQGQYKTKSPGIGSARKEKWPAAILAFVLGTLGIHKYYLGYKTEGLIMLLVTLIGGICLFGVGAIVMAVISIIEAVKYVTLTDEEFQATYVIGYKGWF